MDAHFDVEGSCIIFHSRGGSGKNAKNTEYGPALRLLLGRLASAGKPVRQAWLDSAPVQAIPLAQRVILKPEEASASAAQLFTLMAGRMQDMARKATSKSPHGNANKRIRLELAGDVLKDGLLQVLKAAPAKKDFRSSVRLPTEMLHKVTAEHLWHAVEKLRGGFAGHHFDDSDGFDVLLSDGTRLPPKAVFGVAATEALGFEIKPKHFSGGEHTPCFRMLRAAGYDIVRKAAPGQKPAAPPSPAAEDVDREWAEGSPRLRKHFRRERAAGLREAKKAEFRRLHGGKLFCEKCNEDLVAKYGTEDADACIEVHHSAVLVSEMEEGHTTRLEDLECLCANCHRFEHRRLRNSAPSSRLIN